MLIKKFVGTTVPETMKKIKDELGSNALILDTKVASKGNPYGLPDGNRVEITAAVDHHPKRFTPPRVEKKVEVSPTLSKIKLVKPAESSDGDSSTKSVKSVQDSPEIAQVSQSISQLKSQIDSLTQELEQKRMMNNLSDHLKQLEAKLEDRDFDFEIIKKIMLKLSSQLTPEQQNNSEIVTQSFKKALEGMINLCGNLPSSQNSPIKLMFLGPSGDGKTTCLEKLAYQLVVNHKKKVGLISLDTERIGSLPALISYARILGVRCLGIYDPSELRECLERFKDLDVILFDTKGTNPIDKSELKELGDWVSQIRPDRIFLVLSANNRRKDLLEMAYKFLSIGNLDFLFTKLDQTKRYGGILGCAIQTKRPMGYLSWGDSIAEDFQKVDLEKITELMF